MTVTKKFRMGENLCICSLKKISDHQIQQQNKALKSLEDVALNPKLIKPMSVDDGELNDLHLKNSSAYCDVSGFYFIGDTIVDIPFYCRYHTDVQQPVGMLQLQKTSKLTFTKGKAQCSTKTKEDIKYEELQEGTLAWIHLNLLNNYEISKAFNLDDIRRHQGNEKLRTILFKEGGIDTIMDSLQSKTKQEEHDCINTLAKPTEPTELAGFFLKIKEDHLQDGLIMNMEA